MRIAIPDHISKIADLIAPYMIFDVKKRQYVLVENAPKEVVDAADTYHQWFENNKRT